MIFKPQKVDFTIGKRGGDYYAFANIPFATKLIKKYGVFVRPTLQEIKNLVTKDFNCTCDFEPGITE